jgi:protein-L-isoaspartate(D-aspartate) O-methyltransferase
MIDTYRHKGLRKKLVEILRQKGIRNELILEAIGKIPRHAFLDRAFEEWAYKDVPFPIGADQTISQPYTVAFQTWLLEIKEKDVVLEIGTGSGYQACVLAELGAKVYTIERQESLFHKTNKLLKKLGFNRVRTFLGDGTKGLPRFAPFDKILVTAGATEVPESLLDQLKVGGYLVIPVGGGEDQEMLRVQKMKEHKYETKRYGRFRFVPFLPGVQKDSKGKKN